MAIPLLDGARRGAQLGRGTILFVGEAPRGGIGKTAKPKAKKRQEIGLLYGF